MILQNRTYIFITGGGRCGTTLTRSLIDGCSKINVFPGEVTNFLGAYLTESGFSRKLLIKDNISTVLGHFYGLYDNDSDCEHFRKKIKLKIEELISKNEVSLTANQLLNHISDAVFTNENEIVLVDVTSENISGYLDEFPNSKIIHLIRHPMEQMNSHYRFRFADPNKSFTGSFPGTWEFGDAFYRVYKSFREAQKHLNNNRVHIIKLEHLQTKTRETIDDVFKFMDVSPEEINYNITRRGGMHDAGSTQKRTYNIFISDSDWSCLTQNDLYFLGKSAKIVRDFYDITEFEYKTNKYSIFVLRQLGFIGKNRKIAYTPLRVAKILLVSLSQYIQDVCKKFYFEATVDKYVKGYGYEKEKSGKYEF
jgi:hypothetical protein